MRKIIEPMSRGGCKGQRRCEGGKAGGAMPGREQPAPERGNACYGFHYYLCEASNSLAHLGGGGHTSRLLPFSHSISFHQAPKWQINNPQHLFLVHLPHEVLSEEVAWSGTGEWVPSALPTC